MMYLGFKKEEKEEIINKYIKDNNITSIYTISDNKTTDKYNISVKDSIEYIYYYDLLHNLNKDTLLVLDETLQHSNRYNLDYNCIRAYTRASKHTLIFNYLPILNKKEDFLILRDFHYPKKLRDNNFFCENVEAREIDVKFNFDIIDIEVKDYSDTKEKLIKEVEENINKDANNVPFLLHKTLTKHKIKEINKELSYLTSVKSTKFDCVTYASADKKVDKILEMPSSLKKLYNYIKKYNHHEIDVILSNYNVDKYYIELLNNYVKDIRYVYDKLKESEMIS